MRPPPPPFLFPAPTGRFTPCGTRTPYLMTQSLCPQNTQPHSRAHFSLRLRDIPMNNHGGFTQLFGDIFVHSSRWTDDGSYMGSFFFTSCTANLWTSGAPFFPPTAISTLLVPNSTVAAAASSNTHADSVGTHIALSPSSLDRKSQRVDAFYDAVYDSRCSTEAYFSTEFTSNWKQA